MKKKFTVDSTVILCIAIGALFGIDVALTANVHMLHKKVNTIQKNFDGAIAAMVSE